MSTRDAAIKLLLDSISGGVDLKWNDCGNVMSNGSVIGVVYAHESSMVVEVMDLGRPRNENWRRFEYHDPRFPDTVIEFLYELAGAEYQPPPVEVT